MKNSLRHIFFWKSIDNGKKLEYYQTVLIEIAQLAQFTQEVNLMNIFLDHHSRVPIYEQIKEQIVLDISRGILRKDEQLPSLRQLSAELSLNINTVKRALSELENQGIIYTIAGKGVFVSGDTKSQNVYLEQSVKTLEDSLITAREMGISYDRAIGLVNGIFKGDEEK